MPDVAGTGGVPIRQVEANLDNPPNQKSAVHCNKCDTDVGEAENTTEAWQVLENHESDCTGGN